MVDLLAELQASADPQEVGEYGRGAFYHNMIYVVLDAHSTPQQLANTKLYGHAALRSMLCTRRNEKRNALLKALGVVECMVSDSFVARIGPFPFFRPLCMSSRDGSHGVILPRHGEPNCEHDRHPSRAA